MQFELYRSQNVHSEPVIFASEETFDKFMFTKRFSTLNMTSHVVHYGKTAIALLRFKMDLNRKDFVEVELKELNS